MGPANATDRADDAQLLRWLFLGRVGYAEALALQQQLREAIAAGRVADTLLLLEHPPVVTLGRSANTGHVLISDAELARRGFAKFHVERGGDVTYHGPGQLVGYPLRRIGHRGVRAHVRGMTAAIIDELRAHGVESSWTDDAPGVWTRGGKIAAVGVDARGQVAMHGFSLNVDPALSDYGVIVPCGLGAPVTSMAALGVDPLPTLPELAAALAERIARNYGTAALEIRRDALLRCGREAAAPLRD